LDAAFGKKDLRVVVALNHNSKAGDLSRMETEIASKEVRNINMRPNPC
jgi:hypothetical protein